MSVNKAASSTRVLCCSVHGYCFARHVSIACCLGSDTHGVKLFKRRGIIIVCADTRSACSLLPYTHPRLLPHLLAEVQSEPHSPPSMSLRTPTQRGIGRPSLSPNNNTNLSASTARKASYRALTGAGAEPRTPASNGMDGGDLEVGDAVNVPGDMYGVVKFVGNVRGKNGRFVGVELDREFAARGKNDGDVEGCVICKRRE